MNVEGSSCSVRSLGDSQRTRALAGKGVMALLFHRRRANGKHEGLSLPVLEVLPLIKSDLESSTDDEIHSPSFLL